MANEFAVVRWLNDGNRLSVHNCKHFFEPKKDTYAPGDEGLSCYPGYPGQWHFRVLAVGDTKMIPDSNNGPADQPKQTNGITPDKQKEKKDAVLQRNDKNELADWLTKRALATDTHTCRDTHKDVAMFAVIEFLDDNSVEVVPKSWLLKSGKEDYCFWPKLNQTEKAKKMRTPDTERWDQYHVRVFCFAETYTRGKLLSRRAEETSNLESDAEEDVQSRRKRKKNSRYSESEDDEDTDGEQPAAKKAVTLPQPTLPMPPPILSDSGLPDTQVLPQITRKTSQKNTQGSSSERRSSVERTVDTVIEAVITSSPQSSLNRSQQSCSAESPMTQQPSEPQPSPRHSTPQLSSPRPSSTPQFSSHQPSSTPRLSSPRPSSTPHLSSPPPSSTPQLSSPRSSSTPQLSSPRPSSTPQLSSPRRSSTQQLPSPRSSSTAQLSSPQPGSSTAETPLSFQVGTFRRMTEMENILQEQSSMLRRVLNLLDVSENITPALDGPVNAIEELLELNVKLEDREYAKKMIAYLSSLGGNDQGDVVRRIMRKVATNFVWSHYSILGQKRKKNLSDLKIFDVIKRAFKRNYSGASDKDAEGHIGHTLKHAPHRPGGINVLTVQQSQNTTAAAAADVTGIHFPSGLGESDIRKTLRSLVQLKDAVFSAMDMAFTAVELVNCSLFGKTTSKWKNSSETTRPALDKKTSAFHRSIIG